VGPPSANCTSKRPATSSRRSDLFGAALGKQRVAKLHHPLCMAGPVVGMLEGNVCPPDSWATSFGISPKDFAAVLNEILS